VLHHKNGVRTDNRIENIEIMSKTKHGILHAGAISDEAVRQIRERYAAGTDGTVLAKEYGIPMQRIYLYLKGEARCGSGGPIQGGSLRRNANRSRSGRKAAGRLLDGKAHDGWFRE
jgi:hypothetical protein